MTFAHPPRSRTTAWLALLLGTMAAAVLAAGALAPAAHADANPNDYDCRGHIEAGVQDPIDDRHAGEVRLRLQRPDHGLPDPAAAR